MSTFAVAAALKQGKAAISKACQQDDSHAGTDAPLAMILLLPLLLVIRYGVIAREESYLERKFGQAYRDYNASVRRWI